MGKGEKRGGQKGGMEKETFPHFFILFSHWLVGEVGLGSGLSVRPILTYILCSLFFTCRVIPECVQS